MMPVMDGYGAMQYFRQQSKLSKKPVMVLTVKAMADDEGKCISVGANDYIVKPVNIASLVAMIEKWIVQ